jgi:hypothetical protein
MAHIASLAQAAGNELQDAWETEAGVLKGIGGRFRRIEKGYPPLIMHVLAIGNSRTNTLYVIMFESPESKWKDAWPKGRLILEDFALDDGH